MQGINANPPEVVNAHRMSKMHLACMWVLVYHPDCLPGATYRDCVGIAKTLMSALDHFERPDVATCLFCDKTGHNFHTCPLKKEMDHAAKTQGYKYAWGVMKAAGYYLTWSHDKEGVADRCSQIEAKLKKLTLGDKKGKKW